MKNSSKLYNQYQLVIKIKLIVIFIIILSGNEIFSQANSIFDVDISEYPTINAKFYTIDKTGERLTNIQDSNIYLTENGIRFPAEIDTCPPQDTPKKLSLIFAIDKSSSMSGLKISMIKSVLADLIRYMPEGTEAGITSFNELSYIEHELSLDKSSLISAVQKIETKGGTNFDKAFLEKPSGALPFVARGMNKKVVIFITDGILTANRDSIINKANNLNASIYTVFFDIEPPEILKDISVFTEGRYFGTIIVKSHLKEALNRILMRAREIAPCRLHWVTTNCGQRRNVEFRIDNNPISNSEYEAAPSILPNLLITPSDEIDFGEVAPDSTAKKTVTVTAKNDTITVTGISSDNEDVSVPDLSFSLTPGESKNFEITYRTSDSGRVIAKITIHSNACLGNTIYVGGKYGKVEEKTLELTHPVGGENFYAGSHEIISWKGVLPGEQVVLEYSTDNGDNWNLISENAENFEYNWTVPKSTSRLCLMRATQINKNTDAPKQLWETVGHGIYAIAWDPNGTRIVSGTDKGTIIMWDALQGQKISTIAKDQGAAIAMLDWHPGGNHIASVGRDDTIRIQDIRDNSVRKLSGHNADVLAVQWSHKGEYLASGDRNGKILIWNKNYEIIDSIKYHTDAISDLCWSRKDSFLLSSSWDKTSRVCETESFQKVFETPNMGMVITSVTIDMNNVNMALSGYGNNIFLFNIKTGEKDTIKTSANVRTVSFSPDPGGRFLAAGLNDKSTRLYKLPDYEEFYRLFGYGQQEDIKVVEWNNDGTYLATGDLSGIILVWSPDDIPFGSPVFQQDISDIWEISEPRFASKDIDFGEVPAGTVKDTILTDFLDNKGTQKLRIDEITLHGGDVDYFNIEHDSFPLFIRPSESIPVHFYFRSEKPSGVKSAKVRIVTQSDTVEKSLTAASTEKKIEIITEIIDFGKVPINSSEDTTEAVIRNMSSTSLNFSLKDLEPAEQENYEIIDAASDFTLEPDSSKKLTIRFSPKSKGIKSAALEFEVPEINENSIVRLFGEGILHGLIIADFVEFPKQMCEPMRKDTMIYFKNLGSELIKISSAQIIDDNTNAFNIEEYSAGDTLKIEPDKSDSLNISFQPTFPGAKEAKLVVKSEILQSSFSSTINLIGRYERSGFELSTDTVDFGMLPESTPGSSSFTITNTGNTELKWDLPVILDKFTIVSLTPQIIPSQGSALAKVSFEGGPEDSEFIENYILKDTCGNSNEIYFKAVVIGLPEISAADNIEFPLLLCENPKIDTVTVDIKNSGKNILKIDTIYFTGKHDHHFKVLQSFSPDAINVNPGSSFAINIKYSPASHIGKSDAMMMIKSNARNTTDSILEVPISGRSEKSEFILSSDKLDFGLLKHSTDAAGSFTILNTGSYPISWDLPSRLGKFQILSVKPQRTLPDELSTVKVDFNSDKPETQYSEILTIADSCGNTQNIELTAETRPLPSVALKAGDFCGFPGDTVQMPIILQNAQSFEFASHTGYSINISMRDGVLEPVNGTPPYILSNGEMLIEDITVPREPAAGDTLAFLDFLVQRAYYDTTVIHIENSKALGDEINITSSPGEFVLACGESIRYLIGYCGDIVKLYQSFPNPGLGIVTIEYQVFEETSVEVGLTNIEGKKLAVFDEGLKKEGNYEVRFNAREFAHGVYIYYLYTPSCPQTLTGKIILNVDLYR